MLSKPVMGLELNSFTDVPNFSVVIGDNIYTLDYANAPINANQVSDAVVKNKSDIFIKTDDSGWINNRDGKLVSKESVDISTIKFNNGKDIVVSVPSIIARIQVNPTITKTGINTATFTYNLFDKAGLDITKNIPASEITAITSVSSAIILNPTTGTGTITFNTSSDIDKSIIISLIGNNGIMGVSTPVITPVPPVVTVPSKVTKIQVNPTVTKTGINTATFTYKLLDQNGTDITKIVPVSEINAYATLSSTIMLDPQTGTGTITYNSSSDIDKLISISIVDQNGIIGNSSPSKVTQIRIDTTITKTGTNSATFKYYVLDQTGTDITKTIPDTQISAVASVSSTIVLDPSTSTGIITYNSITDIDTSINITLTDKITGVTLKSVMVSPVVKTDASKVSKIVITSTQLSSITGQKTGYASYCVYDQYGNDVTYSPLDANVIFKSPVGTVTCRTGLLTITANADVDFSTLNSVVITGSDTNNVVSMSATLLMNIIK
jgi:hypothetical protein